MDETEYATGGPTDPKSAMPLLVGHACGCHGTHAGPANITVNIHGTVVGENDLARIIREQVLQYNRRNGDGPASA